MFVVDAEGIGEHTVKEGTRCSAHQGGLSRNGMKGECDEFNSYMGVQDCLKLLCAR
jgi:hypothetical protein